MERNYHAPEGTALFLVSSLSYTRTSQTLLLMILGTCCLCALLEIGLSFTSPRVLKRTSPPIVTGPTVLLIGVKLISSGFKGWAGGSGPCYNRPATGLFSMCPTTNAPHPLPWGSPEFIGRCQAVAVLHVEPISDNTQGLGSLSL